MRHHALTFTEFRKVFSGRLGKLQSFAEDELKALHVLFPPEMFPADRFPDIGLEFATTVEFALEHHTLEETLYRIQNYLRDLILANNAGQIRLRTEATLNKATTFFADLCVANYSRAQTPNTRARLKIA